MDARSVGSLADGQQYDHALEEVLAQTSAAGHRQRLKARFLDGESESRSEAALLELLLSYAIPQRDVRPLAEHLLEKFSSFNGVLAAHPQDLCAVDGLAEHSAVLIKLCDLLYRRGAAEATTVQQLSLLDEASETSTDLSAEAEHPVGQASLFDKLEPVPVTEPTTAVETSTASNQTTNGTVSGSRQRLVSTRGSDLLTKSVLREAIEMLPRLPDTESLDEVSVFLKNNLHFSAWQTRERYAAYINRRMFPEGYADQALRIFASTFAAQQELRDVAFYRFCSVEPLVGRVVSDLLLPAISAGVIERSTLRDYLTEHYPESRSIKDAAQAIVETLVSGGIAQADRNQLIFGYRKVLLPSFAFVIHSEFPEPTMYPLRDLELHPVLRTMLWNPDHIMSALYALRNRGLIARISEIDNVRQFTLRHSLDDLVNKLMVEEVRE
jgi:DNA repair protein RadC